MAGLFIGCVALTMLVSSAAAFGGPVYGARVVPPAHAVTTPAIKLTPTARLAEFGRVLQEQHVSAADLARFRTDFAKLPPGVQAAILEHFSPRFTAQRPVSSLAISAARSAVLGRARPLKITSVAPNPGVGGQWSYASGSGLDAGCTVTLDNVPMKCQYVSFPPLLPYAVYFLIPAGTAPVFSHTVRITNAAHTGTCTFQYSVIYGNYRALYGWKFTNFTCSKIPWYLFRDYFGRNQVESADGTHLASAQSIYDNSYSGMGAGGDCFGMSVASLRIKNHTMTTYWHNWFASNALPFAYGYADDSQGYPANQQTREAVEEDQGAQVSQEVIDACVSAYNSQAPLDVWRRVNQLLTTADNEPMIFLSGHGWGHVVVAYRTQCIPAFPAGSKDYEIMVYDNNRPYRSNELYPDSPEVCNILCDANNHFTGIAYTDTYGDALDPYKFDCISYQGCAPRNPHLTFNGDAGNQAGALVVPSVGTHIAQITDERGHRFFLPNGVPNENRGTRIPNSAPIYPMIASLRPLRLPRRPTLFAFTHTSGKSLTFQLSGAGPKRLTFYAAGSIFQLTASGAGQVRIANILRNNCGIEVLNPAALRPTILEVIHRASVGEHVFQLRGLTGLTASPLTLTPTADGRSLNVRGAPGLKFDLSLRGPVGAGQRTATVTGVAAQTGHAALGWDWGNFGASGLLVQHLSAAGAIQSQVHLRAR